MTRPPSAIARESYAASAREVKRTTKPSRILNTERTKRTKKISKIFGAVGVQLVVRLVSAGTATNLRLHLAVLGETADVMLGEHEVTVEAHVEDPAGASEQLSIDAEFLLE
jgi:hypothetical protein